MLLDLPDELLIVICEYLPLNDRKCLRLVCKRFGPLAFRSSDRYLIKNYYDLVNYDNIMKTLTIRINVNSIPEPSARTWNWKKSGHTVEEIELELCEHQNNNRYIAQIFKHFNRLTTIRFDLKYCCRFFFHKYRPEYEYEICYTDWVDLLGKQPNLKHLVFEFYRTIHELFRVAQVKYIEAAAKRWGSQLREFRIGCEDYSITFGQNRKSVLFLGPQLVTTDVFHYLACGDENPAFDFLMKRFTGLRQVKLNYLRDYWPIVNKLTHLQFSTHLPIDEATMNIISCQMTELEAVQVNALVIQKRFKKTLPSTSSIFPRLRIYIGSQDFLEAALNTCSKFRSRNEVEVVILDQKIIERSLFTKISNSMRNMRCLSCGGPDFSSYFYIGQINKMKRLVQFSSMCEANPPSNLHKMRLPVLEDLYLNMTLDKRLIFVLFQNCPRLQHLYCNQERGKDMIAWDTPLPAKIIGGDRTGMVHEVKCHKVTLHNIFRKRRKMLDFVNRRELRNCWRYE